ncbi:MAG: hypothetical protein M9931_09565 [Chitinophagales bacterium]|nr:hypothetical protein [Chitinophagales bacterium]
MNNKENVEVASTAINESEFVIVCYCEIKLLLCSHNLILEIVNYIQVIE